MTQFIVKLEKEGTRYILWRIGEYHYSLTLAIQPYVEIDVMPKSYEQTMSFLSGKGYTVLV